MRADKPSTVSTSSDRADPAFSGQSSVTSGQENGQRSGSAADRTGAVGHDPTAARVYNPAATGTAFFFAIYRSVRIDCRATR